MYWPILEKSSLVLHFRCLIEKDLYLSMRGGLFLVIRLEIISPIEQLFDWIALIKLLSSCKKRSVTTQIKGMQDKLWKACKHYYKIIITSWRKKLNKKRVLFLPHRNYPNPSTRSLLVIQAVPSRGSLEDGRFLNHVYKLTQSIDPPRSQSWIKLRITVWKDGTQCSSLALSKGQWGQSISSTQKQWLWREICRLS